MRFRVTWGWICAAMWLVWSAALPAPGDETPSPIAAADSLDIDALASKAEAVIQVVLANHIDPPTRQQMWLAAAKALCENVPGTVRAGLSARISQMTRPDEFRDLLRQIWFEGLTPEQRRTALAPPRMTAVFLEGLLGPVRDTRVLAGSEGAAREQSAGNRYVGTGIGYVKIRQVNGSAAHELRRLERQFRADGISAVILDLRSTSSHDVHQALLLADALMDGGTIGRVRLSNGHVQEFHADRECLFRDWPLAVLIDRTTSGGGEWIAAALQDNRACVMFGESSAGSAESNSIVHVPGENLSVQLPTGNFARPSGKPLQKREVPEATPLLVPVRRVAGGAEPAPGGVTPDRIVPVQGVAIVPGQSTTAEQRFFAQARQQQVRGDAVIMAAVVELRDRIDTTQRRGER
jgi:hypothetical protein